MDLSNIINILENWAPKSLQESYDNSGLQIGNPSLKVTKALFTLDVTPEVINEAQSKGCNLIVAHHPLIFKPLKRLTGDTMVEQCVAMAIRSDIAIYAIHTNLDNIHDGVNRTIADAIGIESPQMLLSGKSKLQKIAVYVPVNNAEDVTNAMFRAGAGHINNYSECCFSIEGKGTFMAKNNAHPYVGETGKRHEEPERKVEVIAPEYKVNGIVKAMKLAHPYEEAAYDIVPLANTNPNVGSGMIGTLHTPMIKDAFLDHLKTVLKTNAIRHTNQGPHTISRVAFCGGSGSFLINHAKRAGADAFITGDVTYHSFFDATQSFMIVDVGHYESEQYTAQHLMQYVNKKLPTFATLLSKVHTNPVNIH